MAGFSAQEQSEDDTDIAENVRNQPVGTSSQNPASGNRPISTQPPWTSSGRQLLFIDAGANRSTAGEAVRVHVMREAHRTRRERQGGRRGGRSRQTTHGEIVIFDSSRPSSPPAASEISTATRQSSTPALSDTSATPPLNWPVIMREGLSEVSLQSLQDLRRLAEGYLRSLQLLQPDVLELCQRDHLAITAYLALAALQFGSTEQESANVVSAQFEARALELLRDRIGQPMQMHTNSTVIAVLLLSKLEMHKNNVESALFHRNALQRLIQDRGGMTTLQEQNAVIYRILVEEGFGNAET